jgi:hypothetical protein
VWGYENEADPKVMEKKIEAASSHGVNVFIFDWYWYGERPFLEGAVADGFLGAKNNGKMKFFLMWANHNWGIWPALDDGLRGMNGNENQASTLFLKIRHSEEDLREVMRFCCKTYFSCENYWKIDGKPVYSFYNCNKLFEFIPPADVLRIINEEAQKAGFPGIYTLMNIGCCNDNEYFCGWGRIPRMRDAGFDAVFAYNSGLRSNYKESVAPDKPTLDYRFKMENQRHCWQQIAAQGLPFCPSVTLGSDVSPRWSRQLTYPWDFEKMGYYPISEGNTPERIGELLTEALSFETDAVIINAWNEWSEGMYLLPDTRRGTALLDTIRKILD